MWGKTAPLKIDASLISSKIVVAPTAAPGKHMLPGVRDLLGREPFVTYDIGDIWIRRLYVTSATAKVLSDAIGSIRFASAASATALGS